MTKQLQIYCTIVMLAGGTSAVAEDEEKERPRPQARGGLVAALDTNGDGVIDAAEIDLAVVSLKKLDKNGDGKLTRDEIGSGPRGQGPGDRPGPGGNRPQFDLSSLDKDGDGKISEEEAPQRMRERFDRMDRNGDGFIDQQEQEAIRRFIRERGMQDGEGRRRRPTQDGGDGGSEKPKRPALDDE